MTYIVTARKWRPNRFEDVVGQDHITVTLKNAIKNQRIAHAYLFAGPRGVGKTTTARILAKTLNCLNPQDFEPCNKCDMCQSFNTSQSLDIIEIDGASNRRIEEIRTLRESVKYAPTKGRYKVYIIDEVHMLTNESFNALLKTLEEPPDHTIFIFATTDVHKVPLTIISRCQRFDFRRIELNTTKNLLKQIAESENISIDDQTLTIIAKKADGALRDAESIFDQIVSFSGNKIDALTVSRMLNLVDDEVFFAISDAILNKTYIAAFEITKKIYDNGWNFIDFQNGLIEHFRNIMSVIVTGSTSMIEAADIFKSRYLEYKQKFSESDLLRILNFLSKTQQEMRFTPNQRLKLEVSLCHLIGLEKSSSFDEVIRKLEEIKKKTPLTALSSSNSGNSSASNGTRGGNGTQKTQSGGLNSFSLNGKNDSPASTAPDLSSLSETDFNEFTTVQTKWNLFISAVEDEKFIAADALRKLRLISLKGNKLYAQIDDIPSKNVVEHNKDYFFSKSQDIFGKSITILFDDVSPAASNDYSLEEAPVVESYESEAENMDPNPVVSAIIRELGGEELT